MKNRHFYQKKLLVINAFLNRSICNLVLLLVLLHTSNNLVPTFHRQTSAVADLENFGGGDDKIYEHKLCIISKFCMFMINVLDLAQTCWGCF